MASVRKRTWTSNGKAREAWEVSWVEGGRQHKKSGFRTKKDADAWAVNKDKSILDGTSRNDSHRITVFQASDVYLSTFESRVARGIVTPSYLLQAKGQFYNYIARRPDWKVNKDRVGGRRSYVDDFEGGLGHLKLSEIRPRHVVKFRDDIVGTGMSHLTARGILVALHQFFEFCIQREMIATNPAKGVRVEAPRTYDERVTPPSRALMQRLLGGAAPKFKLMLEFAASSGLRSAEMRALAWSEVDLGRARVRVVRALDRYNRICPPKSHAGRRTVPISSALVQRLREHREQTAFPADDDFVFATRVGTPHGDHALLRRLQVLACRLGEGRLTWHALRHYAISAWIASGLNIKVVSTYAGHADIAITANRYGHLFPDDDHSPQIDAVGSQLIR